MSTDDDARKVAPKTDTAVRRAFLTWLERNTDAEAHSWAMNIEHPEHRAKLAAWLWLMLRRLERSIADADRFCDDKRAEELSAQAAVVSDYLREIEETNVWLPHITKGGPMSAENLGPLPKLHPRETIVSEAGLRLSVVLQRLRAEHGLTPSEMFFLVSGWLRDFASACIASERRNATGEDARADEDSTRVVGWTAGGERIFGPRKKGGQ